MNISTMFGRLEKVIVDKNQIMLLNYFAKTFDRFAKPLGINIDKNYKNY